jgi:hypothetical protein
MSLTRSLFAKVLPLGALMVALAAPAMAQNAPAVEVGGGYNYLHTEDTNVPGGWYAEVSGNLTPVFSVVGQVTANYKSIDDVLSGVTVDTTLASYMGGVRVNARTTNGATPFVHALFGVMHASGSVDVLGFNVGDSVTDPALQLGGGVKFMPGTIGLQVGADYLRTFSDLEANSFRFAAGVVVGF